MGAILVYLIDTNILIYHFNNNLPENCYPVIDEIFNQHFNISVITKIEFLGFRKHTEESFKKGKTFIKNANIINMNHGIVDSVIDLRRKYRIKLPDAVIAATAIINNLTLITRNVDDFKNLDLMIYNPFEQKEEDENIDDGK